jgi:hypothetical protein
MWSTAGLLGCGYAQITCGGGGGHSWQQCVGTSKIRQSLMSCIVMLSLDDSGSALDVVVPALL